MKLARKQWIEIGFFAPVGEGQFPHEATKKRKWQVVNQRKSSVMFDRKETVRNHYENSLGYSAKFSQEFALLLPGANVLDNRIAVSDIEFVIGKR